MMIPIPVGMSIRFDGRSYRPATDEILFARQHGFTVLQFRGAVDGLDASRLGDSLGAVCAALTANDMAAVMEITLGLTARGVAHRGYQLLMVLEANLPAITTLGCAHVHLHLVPSGAFTGTATSTVEGDLVPQFAAALEVAHRHGFRLGFEHNEAGAPLLSTPHACATLLQAVPALGFVWDINHCTTEQGAEYLALMPHMTLLHISDTPLPAVNHHLPLGEGSVDLAACGRALRAAGFAGPAILEIGGTATAGGFGRDTDRALIASRERLRRALIGEELPPSAHGVAQGGG